MNFVERLQAESVILTEGALGTRLIYEFQRPTPDNAHFMHLFDAGGRADLTTLYRSYLEIAAEYDLPMLVGTPTWRAHPDALARHGFDGVCDLRRVNGEAVAFLQDLRRQLGLEGKVYIAGVIGPRIDGYDPDGAPDAATAEAYHLPQARALAEAGVDLLSARTFPGAPELLGVSRAFAATDLPYVLVPVIDAAGRMRDGTLLADAVRLIDAKVRRPPLHFFIGCVHPSHVAEAATTAAWPNDRRVMGLHGNASSRSPEELDRLDRLDEGEPEAFADLMVGLHARGVKVLGGCCGTSVAHIRALARRLTSARRFTGTATRT
ncbi:MAG: homocysteine S-methyltransferase family protein [Dongiaceae bacterium]